MSTISSHRSTVERDARLDAYRTTGPSPGRRSLHLLGVGQVGRALLALLDNDDPLVVAATDTSGTVHDPAGLDTGGLARWKAAGRPLAGHPSALRSTPTTDAVRRVSADVVVDATSTRFDRPEWAGFLDEVVVARGRGLALAAKDAPAGRAHRWVGPDGRARVGINATLGGAGAALRDDIARLRRGCVGVALAGNGSTTVILQVMEAGGTFEDGVAEAGRRGLLETDPELDFRGVDAAVKLAVVTQALWGRTVHPADIPSEDIRTLDAAVVRARALEGRTTRLVARGRPNGSVFVGYEAVGPGDPLAVPPDRAAYRYEMDDGSVRLHIGAGMGPAETARALLADVRRLDGRPIRAGTRRSTRVDAGARTGLVHLPSSFCLESGATLHPAQVAYEVVGPRDGPPVVVLGGLGEDRHVADGDRQPGWWSCHVGAGRALDTNRFRVVSIDWLGGPGGSSGPVSSSHWLEGTSVSTTDQARAVRAVMDALRIECARGVVGASYGGGVALRLAQESPGRVERVCALAPIHDADPGRLSVPCTLVAFDSDPVVTPQTVERLAHGLGDGVEYVEVRTTAGHQGYLAGTGTVARVLRESFAGL